MNHPYPALEPMLELVNKIYEGKIALPEFQRSFVWSNQDIKDLLVSILNGYFIGTFLFLRRGDEFDFEIRYFEGVDKVNSGLTPKPEEKRVDKVVLDGQQRLTALFYVLYSPPEIKPKGTYYPYRYFVKIDERLSGKEWDDAIVLISENDRIRNIEIKTDQNHRKYSFKELLEISGSFKNLLYKKEFKEYCFENGLLPFVFLRSRDKLEDWLEDYSDYLSEKGLTHEEIKVKKKKVRDLFKNWFDFKVPSLTLEGKPFYEVAEIFERINRTGIELSVFALATAVYFKKKINLRDWWKEYYTSDMSVIRKFCSEDDENYPKYILQIMALLQGKEVKKRVLINPKEFILDYEKWNEACKLLDDALMRLENTITGYGVIRPDLLPYKPIVVTLAALLRHCKNDEDYKKVDVWYWSSVFTGRYAGSSDTAIKQDYDQVRGWLKNGKEIPDVVKEAENRIDEMNLRNVDRGALYKAILNLMTLKHPIDFFSGQSIELVRLNDHHIFPKKSGIKLIHENSILNRTLIQDETNKKIWKKKPSQYLAEMEEKLGSWDKIKTILETHLIDEKCLEAMMSDNYEEFIKARERVILEEMKRKISLK